MDFKVLEKSLERIGLSHKESKVYLSLLKLGSSKAGKISKESRINRTTTYDVLKKLLEKGLVSYVVKANVKWFTAANPERLVEYLKEKEKEAKKILSSLKEVYEKPVEKHNVTLYYGYKGLKSVFQDIIREGKTNRVMDSEGQFTEKMPYYAPHFIKGLNKKNIKVKHLVRKGREIGETSDTTEVRLIPKKSRSDAAINIYDNKVAIIIWTEPPEAVLIENKKVADSFKDHFRALWKNAEKK